MGCYINPENESKEDFLKREGKPICIGTPAEPPQLTATHVPVCLVDNGPFTAAGVCFSDAEVKAFMYPDKRFKMWFMVPREKLYAVSDLKNWEYYGPPTSTVGG